MLPLNRVLLERFSCHPARSEHVESARTQMPLMRVEEPWEIPGDYTGTSDIAPSTEPAGRCKPKLPPGSSVGRGLSSLSASPTIGLSGESPKACCNRGMTIDSLLALRALSPNHGCVQWCANNLRNEMPLHHVLGIFSEVKPRRVGEGSPCHHWVTWLCGRCG